VNNNSNTKRDSLESLLNSEHIVEIEKMAIGGDGIARISFQEKSLVVFVPKSAPKDQLRIKIIAVEKNYLSGVISEVLTPGPHRREPPCSYALRCGGCSWQQISDEEQIHQKELLLKELFQKFIPNISYTLSPTVRSPHVFNYRNRIQLKRHKKSLGYFADKSHDLVDIDSCLIADKRISDQIPQLKATLKESETITKFELRLTQDLAFEHHKIGEKGEGLAFSQVNSEMNALLVGGALDLVLAANPKSLTELYAGSGNFSFPLLQKLSNLVIESVELNPELTSAAIKKLTAQNLQKRLLVFTTDCDSFVQRRRLSSDFILLDPPRQGATDVILNQITKTLPKNILYISCHPVSLARDLQKIRLDSLGYKVSHLQIYDMFPQTDHFETMICLTR